jgi:hypothetical protein
MSLSGHAVSSGLTKDKVSIHDSKESYFKNRPGIDSPGTALYYGTKTAL